jgi:hypothetical protein
MRSRARNTFQLDQQVGVDRPDAPTRLAAWPNHGSFAGLGSSAVAVAVVAGPFLEIAAVRLAGAAGLYALSAGYVLFVWLFALLRPVRQAADASSGWSMKAQPLLLETSRSLPMR